MLGIDECGNTSSFLSLCDGMDGKCGLTRRFRTIDFNDSSLGVAAYAQGHIEGDTSSRNHLYILNVLVAKLHDRSLTEVFLYLGHGSLKGLQLTLVGVQGSFLYFVFLCHIFLMFYELVTIKTAWYE